MKKLKSILQLFFRHCPRDAITALGYAIFHPFLNEDEQEDMISRLDVLLTDAHGWTVAAVLHVMGNGRFKDLPMEYYEEEFTKQKVPGKLAPRSDFRQPRAEDDLQFIMDPSMAIYRYPSSYIYPAGHPITLSKKTTYFEVTFNFSEGCYRGIGKDGRDIGEGKGGDDATPSNVTNEIDEEHYFSVGVRSKVSQLLPGGGAISWESIWNTGSEDGYKTARKAAFGISPTEHDGKHIIGCGMNSLERKIFFSVNGKVLPAWFSTSKSLQLPIITLHNCDMSLDGFLVNFGRTKFIFEDANTSDWVWDGEVPQVDGIHLIHRPGQDVIIRDGRFILPRDY
ncbi:hypothetical protein TWF132_006974 [Orbilia oligospora]|nr:hypothetical protein TWF132_006974 [Orbilia oligospora]